MVDLIIKESDFMDPLILNYDFSQENSVRERVVYDLSNNKNDGELVNDVRYNDIYEGCLSFTGKGGYVKVSDSDSLDLPDRVFSIVVVFNCIELEGQQILISKGKSDINEEYTISFSERSIYWDFGANGFALADIPKIEEDTWHTLVATYDVYDKIKGKIYFDGSLMPVRIAGSGQHIVNSKSDLYIGNQNAGKIYHANKKPFNGLIKKVQIHTKLMSEEEIKNLHNAL